MKENEEFYFSVLRTMKDEFDSPLIKIRGSYRLLSVTAKSWILVLLFRSFAGFVGHKAPNPDSVNKMVSLMSHYYITFTLYAGASFLIGFKHILGLNWTSLLTWLIPFIFFLGALYANFTRMLTIGDPMFHAGIYEVFRKQEFKMILTYLNNQNFSFDGLSEWITKEITKKEKEKNEFAIILERTNSELLREKVQLVELLHESEQKLLGYEKRHDEILKHVDILFKQAKVLDKGYNRAIDILSWLKDPPTLKKENLALISDYSLFVLRKSAKKQELYKIDQFGTLETPDIIRIDDPNFSNHASVKVIKNQTKMEFSISDRANHSIASYRFIMQNGNIWVYNFHYYTDDIIRDIIETEQFNRLMKIMLGLLLERNLLKDGDPYASST